MGINLSAVMLVMGAGMADDVKECGKIRILGLYLQDTTESFSQCVGPGLPFDEEISAFMDKAVSVYPGSMFGVYGFTDRYYGQKTSQPTRKQGGDFVLATPLTDVETAKTCVKNFSENLYYGGGGNSDAFDVMYHLVVDDSDSGLDKVTPLADTYDAKVLYVFTDGIPLYIEATDDECAVPADKFGAHCSPFCTTMGGGNKCCYPNGPDNWEPAMNLVDNGTKWNSFADCPIDIASVGKVIRDNDWYVVYIAVTDLSKPPYYWDKQVPLLDIESRLAFTTVNYSYTGLADVLVNITSKVMCSTIPSNDPSAIPSGHPEGPTTAPTVAPTTSGSATAGSATAPTTGGSTSGPTQSGQGGTTTTTTTKKPFPIGLVCGCAAGALVAVAGGLVAANRLTGYPPMPEFEFEGDEGMGREESQRETQVAMGEADFA